MNSLFLIFLSSADSGIRFLATFTFQTNADPKKVSVLYEFLVLSNLFCIPFLAMIPVTYRFAYFGSIKRTISNIYFNLLFYLVIIYFTLLIFCDLWSSQTAVYSIIYGFFLALLGTLISILNIQGVLRYLQTIKLLLGVCVASILFISLIFSLESEHIFVLLIMATLIFCKIAIGKIKFMKISLLKVISVCKWSKLAIYRYRGATMNTILLLVYTNIDRLIVVNVADDVFVTQYALSTTICAPILIIANVMQLRYWPEFAKKGSGAQYKKQMRDLVLVSIGLGIMCFCTYLILKTIDVFPDRLPSPELYALVIFYYCMYPITQFNLFYSGLKRPSLVKSCILIFCTIIGYFGTKNISQLIYVLPLLAFTFALLPSRILSDNVKK